MDQETGSVGEAAAEDAAVAGGRVGLGTIAKEWGRIGSIGFGGPPTHIALLRKLCVEHRGWIGAAEFEDGIAATNLLPGPASTQLAIFTGLPGSIQVSSTDCHHCHSRRRTLVPAQGRGSAARTPKVSAVVDRAGCRTGATGGCSWRGGRRRGGAVGEEFQDEGGRVVGWASMLSASATTSVSAYPDTSDGPASSRAAGWSTPP
ncbi:MULTISPECIES: chromate transporter [unclassified Kitasatospora]|uniref:chromate transporter n=1 Tax=unclassified Kitasatospora TaxID=2633591 RepID=UPI0033D03A05